MVMRSMRDSAKWVMLVLSIAFVGWLVLDWVTSRGGAGVGEVNPVVARVAGREIRYTQWTLYLQNQLAAVRDQRPGGLSEEEARIVREAAWNDLISGVLLEQEIDRLGIRVSDREIREAFRSRPPPEFLNHPAFLTDGSFDLEKYRQYFSSPAVDETLLLQLETYYRETLPREKLVNLVAEGIFVSDRELWQYYRDANETATARFLAVDPALQVPDSLITVSEAEVLAYYRANQDEFARPATATVNLVSIGTQPSEADSVAALVRVDSLREAVVSGGATFEDVARSASADSISGARGGEIGPRVRGELDPAVEEVAFSLPIGRVSSPIFTPFGYQIVRVDSRAGDTVSVRRILVPIALSPATEDSVFDVMDELEGIALRSDLVSAADSLGIPVRRNVVLTDGSEFVPGAGALGVAPEWALDLETQLGDLSQFFETPTAYHVLELVERQPAGTFAVEDVEADIESRLRRDKSKERARQIAEQAVAEFQSGSSFREIADRYGWTLQDSATFRRMDFVPGLGQATEAIGAAFGLEIGKPSGVLDAGDGLAILEVLSRTEVTREEFEEVRAELRQRLTLQRRQAYVQQWLASLRESSEIRDLRDQLAAAATSS